MTATRSMLVIVILALSTLACNPIIENTSTADHSAQTGYSADELSTPTSPSIMVSIAPKAGGSTPTPAPSATASEAAPVQSAPSAPNPAIRSWLLLPDLPRHVNVLAVDPGNPRVLYAGTGSSGSGSGVYKSEDAGLTWRLASNGLPGEDVRALAFSHTDPPTLFATLGHQGEVYASSNGAQSWDRLGDYELSGFKTQLAVAPSDASVLFVAEDVRGVYRSLDGGRNWHPVGDGLPQDADGQVNVQSVAIDPIDANIVYLGTGWSSFGGNGVYKSTDGGATWTAANRGMIDYGITALAVDPTHPQVVYAGTFEGDLFNSVDGGQTWHDLTEALPLRKTDRSTIVRITIDPETPETVYLLVERFGALVSYDSGTRWHLLGKPGELEHPSFTAMAAIAGAQPVLVAGTRGEGGWRSGPDQPASVPTSTPPSAAEPAQPPPRPGNWQPALDLPRQINALVTHTSDQQAIYAGTGSSGSGSGVYKSEDAGLTWRLASNGLPGEDVRALAFSHTDPPTLFATLGHQGEVYASSNGAQSWDRLGDYELSGFKTQLAVAPSDANVLFVAEDVRGAYRSLDGGRNWHPVGDGLPQDADGQVNVQSVAIDPIDANIVYLGTGWSSFGGNGVYKSTDGGATWTAANRGMIDYGITALAVDPTHPQVVYAGTFEGDLFNSVDGGQTWHDLTEALPLRKTDRSTIVRITIDPETPETVYLLVERFGALVSYDSGTRWHLLGKPGELEHPSFTAMATTAGAQPILVIGARDESGWRYTAD